MAVAYLLERIPPGGRSLSRWLTLLGGEFWVVVLMSINSLTLLWEVWLLREQFEAVATGTTTYFRQGGSSAGRRPCSPLDQEKALKEGWLKRQRSIMKNWQLRWFVLRVDALYFYKDQDESKAQGCIPLQGSRVNELSASQDEPGRHLFEIVPGGAGEKDRTGTSHESFLLMANSQADMEEWIRAIRRVIWAPLGGGKLPPHTCSLIQTHRH
ncbi:unnamed protein product [Tetraodon nigroviridis]|uniref:Chromosome 17 SCAF15006, whole genome shotgun sequence n=1 Tax=Tetraodon nigroviridis TaxID=99883 RepID=Q4RQF6_TETNG|nr:unnamed protein product [Tetraodon nigroviridis]